MSAHFKNFVLDNETLTFEVYGLNPSFCNALRRIMISEIETLGFRSSYDESSDIKIEVNTSELHNEFLGHRLSLLPIHYPPKDITNYVKDKYDFIIEVVNNGNEYLDVTTKDIKIFDKTIGKYLSEVETRNFFPPNPITNDYIFINTLNHNQVEGMGGEEVKIIMKADKSIGKEHSRYVPTCVSVFVNKIDEARLETAFKEKMSLREDTLTSEEIKKEAKSFRLGEGERHYYIDETGEPNVFEFIVESDRRIPPPIILYKSLFVLEEKIKKFKTNLNNEEVVTFKNSDCIMNSYDVIVKNEDYTLGYIIQKYVYQLYQMKDPKDIKYISTDIPHPLENNLVFRISLENSVDKDNSISNIKKVMEGTIDYINEIIVKLKGEMKNQFKGNLDL
jgi:DNA-directed RNA polymerase subunit L